MAALLDRARPARLFGLVDPALPDLEPALQARLDGIVRNAYAASLTGADALVSLAPGTDALFVARLLLDPSLPSIGPQLPSPSLGLPPAVHPKANASSPRLPEALNRYWRSTIDLLAPESDLWARAASAQPQRAAADGLVVLTNDRAAPLCLALQRLGADVAAAAPVAALSPNYRNVLYILGNAPADAPLISLLRRYGGDVVLTEACLLAAYDDPAALDLAAKEIGRVVPQAELRQWRAGVARPPALLLADVAASASRLFVHSDWLAGEIRARYRREAIVLPVAADGRQVGAHAAGLWAECCVWAVEMLTAWGAAVRLDLVCPPSEQPALVELAARLGLADRLRFAAGTPDIALVLAMRGEAGRSGALAQATRVPCIASRSIIEAVDAPCAAVLPDQPSPPLLAEAILALLPKESAADRAAAALKRALAGP